MRMIQDRFYQPARDEILYHYCDEPSFRGIIESRTIWASAFYALNDPAERRWGHNVFVKSCERLKPAVESHYLDIITDLVNKANAGSILMVSSFSLHPDHSYQWERYAASGKGFAIGFSANALRMPAKPLRVLYDPELQIRELTGNLRHIYGLQRKLDFPYEDEFQEHCFHLGLDLCAYKDPAFQEEMEVRYAHMAGLTPGQKIIPLGARGPDGTRLSEPCETRYRTRAGVEVPYVALDWSDKGRRAPVATVTLGPNNTESEEGTRVYLDSCGLAATRVTRSTVRVP
jgi:Protein of unknown function (DUF2971)